jgi:hypothetical protein
MSNSKNSEKSKEDQKNEEPQPRERSRMDRSHGGKLLDAISQRNSSHSMMLAVSMKQ